MRNAIWIYSAALLLIAFNVGCGAKHESASNENNAPIDLFDVMKMAPPSGGDVVVTNSTTACLINLEFEIKDEQSRISRFKQRRTEESREQVKTYSLDQSASILAETKVKSTTWQKKESGQEEQTRYAEFEYQLDEYKKTAVAGENLQNYAVHTKLRRKALPGFFFEDGTNEKFNEKRNYGRMYDDGKTFYYEHDNEGDILRPANVVFSYTADKSENRFHKVMTLAKPYVDPEYPNKKILNETRDCTTVFEAL